MMRKTFTLFLAFLFLLTLFAGCATEPSGGAESPDPGSSNPEGSGSPEDSDNPGEITEISFWIPDFGTDITDYESVETALNEISEEAIGVRVRLSFLSVDSYGTQLSLAVSNQEPVDLALCTPVDSSAWINFYSNGCILDMAPLLEEYGQDLSALLGEELLHANDVDGAIYGLPNYRQLNSNTYLCYRTDVLQEAGVLEQFESMTTWSEFETVLQGITDNCPGVYAIGGGGDQPVASSRCIWGQGSFADGHAWDALGDTLNIIYSDQSGNVSNVFTNPEMIATFEMLADWNAKGYIYPDSSISQEASEVLIMQKIYAGSCVDSEYGVEANKKQTCGTDMSCVEIIPGQVTTSDMRKLGTFIPASSKEPAAAMRFLNLMYTNADVMNLLVNGIEGRHYTVEDGVGYFLDGKDISSSGYHTYDFLMGNQFLCWPWDGAEGGAAFREDALADYQSAENSVYCGLTVDTAGFDTVIAALSSVKEEYYFQIANGLYTEEMYAEFLEKQEAAGVEEYVGLYQAAVSEFMEEA